MTESITLPVAEKSWAIRVPADKLVHTLRTSRTPNSPAAGTAREMARIAVENAIPTPNGPAALTSSITATDTICIVIDEHLPQLGELLAGVLDHLSAAGIEPTRVTLLSPAGPSNDRWVDDLPDEYADVRTEQHDLNDRQRLAYLATTKSDQRVYLNRTLVESDVAIVLGGRGYDAVMGYRGAECAIYPALAGSENVAAFLKTDRKGAPAQLRAEAREVAWLLGTPFLVQVFFDEEDRVAEVLGGLLDSSEEGTRRQDARWSRSIVEAPDTIIATVNNPDATFAD
ncbi:MAG: lactate racemase domain-containing protein, partial [Gemmataceae bacterium]